MSNPGDFVIENGVLKKYVGPGGDVVVPEGVTEIGAEYYTGAFYGNKQVSSVTLPEGLISICELGFAYCENLKKILVPESLKHIGSEAFKGCEALADENGFVVVGDGLFGYYSSDRIVNIPNGVKVIYSGALKLTPDIKIISFPESLVEIRKSAIFGETSSQKLVFKGSSLCLPEEKLSLFFSKPEKLDGLSISAPSIPLSVFVKHGLAKPAIKSFLANHANYTVPEISMEYAAYLAAQRKTWLPVLLKKDGVGVLKLLADAKKITGKNLDEYLLQAKQAKATRCVDYLEEMALAFGFTSDAKTTKAKTPMQDRTLWDGVHFSLDGKKLLKYKEVSGQTTYDVPDGTKEICEKAFFWTALREINIPESVTTIRNGAFTTRGTRRGQPLYVRLPKGLKRLPAEAFWGGSFDGDVWQKYYFVSTSNLEFIPTLCCDSYSKGCRCPIYTGGEIDDLQPREKLFAVKGFLYALQTGVEDMSRWRTGYLEHIRRNEKTYVKQAAEDDFLLHLMIDEKLLSASGAKQLISTAEKNKEPERIAALLAYQSIQFGAEDTAQAFSLSDDNPEMKRMLKMAARKEQIRDQKGITGLIFVCTGDLDHFGYVDEYTGARDFGDLKAYIEARGGFLRSAVSSKTDYLICNDPSSQTIKSKKAKELGTSVITEEEFLRMADEA